VPIVDVAIEKLALEGEGLGKIEAKGNSHGKMAFVPYGLPGEHVRAEVIAEKKGYIRGLPQTIHQPSSKRIQPKCPYHFQTGQKGSWCGGCDWQHLSIEAQRNYKKDIFIETLQRLGGFPNPPVHDTLSAGSEWRYRNKVQVPFGRKDGKVVAGFYQPGTHTIVEFSDCLVQPPLGIEILKYVLSFANDNGWLPYDQNHHQGWLRHLLIRTNRAGQALVTLVTKDAKFPHKHKFVSPFVSRFKSVVGLHQNVQPARTHVILGRHWTRLWGADWIGEELNGLTLGSSAASFFQINPPAAELLYQKALEAAQLDHETLCLDLYCGVGCLTLLAAARSKGAVGVEAFKGAVLDARKNAKENGVRNVEFEVSPSEKFFTRDRVSWLNSETKKLVVFLDPPRAGCEKELLKALLKLEPRRIISISCNPSTLARDLKFLSSDYQLTSSVPVDLFPQTSHVESVSLMEPRNP